MIGSHACMSVPSTTNSTTKRSFVAELNICPALSTQMTASLCAGAMSLVIGVASEGAPTDPASISGVGGRSGQLILANCACAVRTVREICPDCYNDVYCWWGNGRELRGTPSKICPFGVALVVHGGLMRVDVE